MPLLTLQTRLVALLAEAQSVRSRSGELAIKLGAESVSVAAIVRIGLWAREVIDSVIIPAQADASLASYAAIQFDDPDFGLATQLAGIKYLMEQVIAASQAIAPASLQGMLWEDVWVVDGVGVTVERLTPGQTATVAGVLQAIHDNIPE